jgi:hypothetical protein
MDRFDSSFASGRAAQQQALNLAEFLVRGSAQMLKLQSSATRAMLATQGRTAAMLGLPDWSAMFNGPGSEQLEALLDTGAEQAVRVLRTSNDTVQQAQQRFAELVEQQTRTLSERMRESVDAMTRRSREGVQQFTRMSDEAAALTRDAVEEVQQAAQPPEQPPVIVTPEGTPAQSEANRNRRGH